MMNLCFATHNKHKAEEVSAFLAYQVKTLDDIGCFEEIEETEDSFRGNSLLKARFVYENYRCNCFADDSGLEVIALNNAPGVYSARFSGEHGNHAANNALLLAKMDGIIDRRARFRAVICLILDGEVFYFEGVTEGRIAEKLTGDGGFGYDPLFFPDGYDRSFAQMTMREKNDISHRGKALVLLKNFLNEKIGKS
jgi:XTP/dITP diphosphohydrolase